MGPIQASLDRLALSALVFLPALGCSPYDGESNPPGTDLEITEVEPNDDVLTAQTIGLADAASVRLLGTIANEDDIDLYELGAFQPGDRITVDVNTSQTELNASAVLFDTDPDKTIGTLFAANDDAVHETSSFDPFMDQVVRHSAEHYFLAIEASFGTLMDHGAYDITIRVERGGPPPQPQGHTLLLDFDGGSAVTRTGQTVTVAPFDAESIHAGYAGRTQEIKDVLAATVRENFAGFNVDILTTDEGPPPAGRPFSAVFIGAARVDGEIPGAEGLGVALNGTDAYNQNPTDNAIVFVENFGPAGFGLLNPINEQELGVALGNVAAHEAGHLFGLQHVYDPTSIMNTLDAPLTLLLDQRFKRSSLHFTICDGLGLFLTQDARLLLAETVGHTVNAANFTLKVGDKPAAVVAAELDAGNGVDLAVANLGSDEVSILLNSGDATLAQAISVDTGAGSAFISALDANRDDDLDLLTADPGAQALVLLVNDGQGRFAPGGEIAAGDGPVAVTAADFDGDGDSDVAAANFISNDVSILLNDGNAGFQTGATHVVGEAPGHVTVADLNGDAAGDLIVTNLRSGDLSLLFSNGDGTFTDAVRIAAGYLPGSSTAADLDGDGDLDLAAADRRAGPFGSQFIGSVSVLMNRGDGTFETAVEYFAGGSPESVAAADLDGDGDIDLALACSGDFTVPDDAGQMSVLLNSGNGTFAQDVVYQAGQAPQWITAADLNADGAVDLIVANFRSNDLSIFLNRGDGRFGVPVGGQ